MHEETRVLQEVVVTAMGISRESKTLTYATQTIKNEEVTRIKDNNFINSLQGKSAGLTIVPNNSGAGGGASKIVLRGSTSILGTNQPLIVVDGVPMQDGMGTQATDNMILGGGRSGDDLLSTINPEDIDNMTILKGPNAAALYGSAANNGDRYHDQIGCFGFCQGECVEHHVDRDDSHVSSYPTDLWYQWRRPMVGVGS